MTILLILGVILLFLLFPYLIVLGAAMYNRRNEDVEGYPWDESLIQDNHITEHEYE